MPYVRDNGPVVGYNITTGHIVEYEYMNKAEIDGFAPCKISLVLSSKNRITHKNFFWFKKAEFSLLSLKEKFMLNKIKNKHKNKKLLDEKICNNCKILKSKEFFYPRKSNIDGLEAYCKECCYIRRKKIPLSKSRQLEYYLRYKDNLIEYSRTFQCKMANKIRSQHRRAHKSQRGSFFKYLGCSPSEFKLYIESLFKPGMSWENRTKWHLDHIIQLSSVDLSIEENIKKVFHYTNVRPLWAHENVQRRRKYET